VRNGLIALALGACASVVAVTATAFAANTTNKSAAFSRLLADAKSGTDSRLSPLLLALRQSRSAQLPAGDGGLRRKFPTLRTEAGTYASVPMGTIRSP